MTAIFEIGMKQYKVRAGDVIKVEKLHEEDGAVLAFDSVIAIVDGANTVIGKPYIAGAKVTAEVVNQGKHKKVVVYKFKSKKGFHKKKGHRQPFTTLKIQNVAK
ncbi:MAG: 50S ribosomal protein L21 [Defluviitaleaceae bacterium]|nr:50S ribosomal protein L21 [Defluviitaleaceae bacterium]